MRKIIFLITMFFAANYLIAREYSLLEAINTALKNNREINVAFANIKISKEQISDAKRNYYPQVNLSLTKVEPVKNSSKEGITSFNLVQPLWTGGKLKSVLEQNKASLISAEAKLEKVKQEIILETIRCYLMLLKQEKKLENNQKLLFRMNKIKEIVEKEYKEKLINQFDYLDIIEKHNRASLDVKVTENEVKLAEMDLKKIMNINIAANVFIEKEKYNAPNEIESEKFQLLKDINTAIINSPIIKHMKSEVKYYKKSVVLARANFLPEFNMQASYNMTGNELLDDDKKEYYVGIEMKMFLFGHSLTTNFEQDKYEDNIISSNDYNTRRYKMNLNLFDNSASIITTPLDTRKSVKNISSLSVQTRQAEQNLKEAVKTLELEKQNVEYGIRQTNQNIEKLKLEFKIYNETIGFQQKRVELAEVKFKMGELKPVDLLTTYLDLYESKKQKLEVWYDYIFNNFTYKYLTGKLNFSDGVD